MKGFMTQKGFMKGFMRLINPFEGFIILRLFFTVCTESLEAATNIDAFQWNAVLI